MSEPGAEQAWWNAHADRPHIWGETDPGSWDAGTAACRAALLSSLGEQLSGRVLDLGCGTGRLAVPLAEEFPAAHIIGVDISPAMLVQAEALASVAGVTDRCEWLLCDGRALPAELGRVDAAYSVLLFQHIPPPAVQGYIREVGRVLRPGGLFVTQYVYVPQDDSFLSWAYGVEALEAMGADSGLFPLGTARGLIYRQWAWTVWRRLP